MTSIADRCAHLPNLPGVYYFYRDETLLYIGKSVDIKQRVQSHFYAAKTNGKEARLASSTNRIEFRVTPGELSALLLESSEIKRQKPIYNRRLRRKTNLLSWHVYTGGKLSISLAPHCWPPKSEAVQFGLYRNRYKAVEALKQLSKEHGLCEQRLGLSKANGPCFSRQIGRCKGVCVGQESAHAHDQRLLSALENQHWPSWPFVGPIAIRESDTASKMTVLYKWHYYGEAPTVADAIALTEGAPCANSEILDLDAYRIILGYLKQKKYAECIELGASNSGIIDSASALKAN